MQFEGYGFLGSDVSKGMCNFLLQDVDGQVLESNFQLDDNYEGHRTLEVLLKSWKEKHELKKIVVGVESTGGYENNWFRSLRSKSKKLDLIVYRVNPKRIYHESKTCGVRTVTDGVSAKMIANYLRKNLGQNDLRLDRSAKEDQKSEETEGLKVLYRYIKKMTNQNTRIKNALEKLLYSALPEVLSFKGEGYPNWFLELLRKYPSRELILSAGVEGLTSIAYVTEDKAKELLDLVKNSVNIKLDKHLGVTISAYAEDIQYGVRKMNQTKDKLVEASKKDESRTEDMELINSIKGIADYTTIGILLEMGDLSRFESAGNLVAYFGINPTIKQSGDKHYKVGMSKDGSAHARAILYLAAKNVVMYESYFQAIYQRQIISGKKHRSALGVVMSKLTRVIYGMLKTRTTFDPGVDTLNQTKKIRLESKVKKKENSKERRYQKEELNAPISSRQKRKRKQEQIASI